MQSTHPIENAFNYKNLLFLINNQSLRSEEIMTFLNTTFHYTPVDTTSQTVVINGNELYILSVTDNIFTFYSIDGKYLEQPIPLLHTLIESIVLHLWRFKTPILNQRKKIQKCKINSQGLTPCLWFYFILAFAW